MPITVYRSGGVYFVRFSLRVKPRRAAFVVGDFTAFMKSIELKFCGDDYCAYIALPPGKYLYRYLVDGEVVLDDGPVENGYNVLILRGSVRRVGPTVARRRLFRAIYGIFVDRFECKRVGGPRDRLGGDLESIRRRLDYIKSLGFDAIYLTPIFKAMSYHRYDVVDYFSVDDDLGGDKAFRKLVRDAHERGIGVILDMPIHHTGSEHPAFRRALEGDPDYFNWFYIYGNDYEKFMDVKKMPKLDVKFAGEWIKGIMLHWSLMGVDAFRIDVGAGIPPWYLWDVRNFINKPLIAEVWGDAFLWRGAVDGVMNYQVWESLIKFLGGDLDAEAFVKILRRQMVLLPRPFLLNSWLFIDTHDTPRAMTTLGDTEKVKAALAFIYTWIGTPMLYYGDEIGLEGGPDPDNRRCMDWGREGVFHELITRLTKLNIKPRRVLARDGEVVYYDENYEVRLSNEPRRYGGGVLSGEYFVIRSK
ncbi:MAG: alpha-amylase family glycosyl hydrolase [Vulcanisaeta sp.]|nr:alpha-amylase family glycosyl hydrolase [Vulcanisaeta sp.]MCG2887685.1 alpha-amylase family glycosyl hydrolase [Vulcanisaeta sp.]